MNGRDDGIAGVSFDLFGTLVAVVDPPDPATAIATELAQCGIDVPADWEAAYSERHLDTMATEESSLYKHVRAALASRGVSIDRAATADRIDAAVSRAFDREVRRRSGALEAIDAASAHAQVGILSNCSVPGLAEQTLTRAGIEPTRLDGIVTSVDIGRRKPDPRAFHGIADALGIDTDEMLHVGDDRRTDGAATAVGTEVMLIEDRDLPAIAQALRDRC